MCIYIMLTSLLKVMIFRGRSDNTSHTYVNESNTFRTHRVMKETRDTIVITTTTVWLDPVTKRKKKQTTQQTYRTK